jgi:hypothetical protein
MAWGEKRHSGRRSFVGRASLPGVSLGEPAAQAAASDECAHAPVQPIPDPQVEHEIDAEPREHSGRGASRVLGSGRHAPSDTQIGGRPTGKEAVVTTATVSRPTSADTLKRLEELLSLATEVALAEERLKTAASDPAWDTDGDCLIDAIPYTMSAATRAEIASALSLAAGQRKCDECPTPLEVCQEIQDAIDVLKFAIERSGDDD